MTVDPELLQRLEAPGKPPRICLKIQVEECFFHCSTAIALFLTVPLVPSPLGALVPADEKTLNYEHVKTIW